MAGLVPAIHALLCSQGVDARDKRGHDVARLVQTYWKSLWCLAGPRMSALHSSRRKPQPADVPLRLCSTASNKEHDDDGQALP